MLLQFATLTPREREVMALIVHGMLNKQIAYELGVSLKTVKNPPQSRNGKDEGAIRR